MSFVEILKVAGLVTAFWFVFVPVDRGMGCGWDLPWGIRGLVWLYRRIKR